MTAFKNTDQKIMIPGPEGDLEAITFGSTKTPRAIAVICHPHPLKEGTMHNKVIYMLSRAFADLGVHSVRFNYRGVGKSEGAYGAGEGETQDCLAVMDWIRSQYSDIDYWLSGFSFGGYVAANATNQRIQHVSQLVTIAPAVTLFDFDVLTKIDCPWLVVQGDQDDVIDSQAVAGWSRRAQAKPDYVEIPGAGHFFHGRLLDLRHVLELELA